jgi:hypothetical protein
VFADCDKGVCEGVCGVVSDEVDCDEVDIGGVDCELDRGVD